ncbi:hypothetical protein D3C73_779750 [compost metagenome]
MNVTAGEFKLKSESPPEYSGREVLLRSSRACSDIARSVYEIAKAAGISPKARSRIACGQQVGESSAYRLGVIPTKPEQYCFAMLKAFDAEANDQKNSAQWLIDYVRGTGIPLGSYVPYGVIELVDSKNSIGENGVRLLKTPAAPDGGFRQTRTCVVSHENMQRNDGSSDAILGPCWMLWYRTSEQYSTGGPGFSV